jgi:CRISPR system Cascade subunit CasD
MNTRHTLLMPLAGPMQSWGYRSRFDDRDTALEPTRSGILGLLCAACCIPRADIDSLRRLNDALRIGVRVDAPGRVMVDFHTAQNVLKASGGLQETVISNRFYLADARFMVGLESASLNLLRELETALRDPAWTLCLGRKSFPLAQPPYLPDDHDSLRLNTRLEDALQAAPWFRLRSRERPPASVRCVIEREDSSDGPTTADGNAVVMTMGDLPLDFENRHFGLRRVIVERLSAPLTIEEGLCTSHD